MSTEKFVPRRRAARPTTRSGDVGSVAGTIQPGGRRGRVVHGPQGLQFSITLTPADEAKIAAARQRHQTPPDDDA